MKNNWKPVIEDIIKCLLDQSLTLHSVDNGDVECVNQYGVTVDNIDEAVELIDATDESSLYVRNPDGKIRWIFIVLGNEPCETICDYTCDPLIDIASENFYNMWELKSVPKLKD